MKLMLVPLSLLLFALSGCGQGPFDAPPSAQFIQPDDLQIPWFACPISEQTGLPAPNCTQSDPVIFPLSVYVTDTDTDLPFNNIRVTFTSLWPQIYVLPQSVIEAVGLPNTEKWSSLSGGGEVFAEFSGNLDGDYKPTFHDTWTDAAGRARTWVYIETMPTDDTGQATESSILADMGVETMLIRLQSAG